MFLMFGAVCCRKRYSLGEFPGLPALRGTGLGEQGQMDLQTNPGAVVETPRLLFVYLCIYGDHMDISYILIAANTDMGLLQGPSRDYSVKFVHTYDNPMRQILLLSPCE